MTLLQSNWKTVKQSIMSEMKSFYLLTTHANIVEVNVHSLLKQLDIDALT